MQLLILNASLYTLLCFLYYKKHKIIDVYFVVWMWYCFIAISGCYSVFCGVYGNIYGLMPKNECISAYIYVLVLFAISTIPLKSIRIGNGENYIRSNYIIPKIIYKFCMWIVVAYALMKANEAYIALSSNLGDIYTNLHEEGKMLATYSNPFLVKLSTSGYMLYNALFPFLMFYIISEIVNAERKRIPMALFVQLSTVIITKILEAISNASRGGIVLGCFDILFFYILFIHAIPSIWRKRIALIATASIIGVVLVLVMITSERVGGETENIVNGIILYLGETFPNIECRYWDEVEYHPMGERLFGLDNHGSLDNFFYYWTIRTKVVMACFKTLPIDLYIEFGKIGGIIFLIIFSFMFKKVFNYNGVKIWTIGLMFWYYQLCVSGIFSWNKRGDTNLKIFIAIILFGLLLYFKNNSKK